MPAGIDNELNSITDDVDLVDLDGLLTPGPRVDRHIVAAIVDADRSSFLVQHWLTLVVQLQLVQIALVREELGVLGPQIEVELTVGQRATGASDVDLFSQRVETHVLIVVAGAEGTVLSVSNG